MRIYLSILVLVCLCQNLLAQPLHNEWIDYSRTYYKFFVRETKLVRITKAALNNAGLGNANAEDFQLWRQGQEVPIYTSQPSGPLAANGYIELLGQPNDGTLDRELYLQPERQANRETSMFADTCWYYLTLNPGRVNKRITDAPNTVATTTLAPEPWYIHQLKTGFFYTWNYGEAIPENNGAWRSSLFEPGEGYCSQPFNKIFPYNFRFNGLLIHPGGPPATLAYSVSGNASYFGNPMRRNVLLNLDGVQVGKIFLDEFQEGKDTVRNIPLSRFTGDAAILTFTCDNEFYWENIVANHMSIWYPRQFNFFGSISAEINLPATNQGHHLRLARMRHDNQPTLLYDINNNRRYAAVMKGDSSLFALPPSAAPRSLMLLNQVSQLTTINSLTAKQFVDYRKPEHHANYLIFTANVLDTAINGVNQVREYARYRSSVAGGAFQAGVYDVAELAEQFAWGINRHPVAFRNFLKYARQHFTIQPRFALLLGHGGNYNTVRVSGNYAFRENLTAVGTVGDPVSDNLLFAENYASPIPMLPLGRVAAVTPQEVAVYLDKVKQYEAVVKSDGRNPQTRDWQKHFIFMTGGDDSFFTAAIGNFMRSYEAIAEQSPLGAAGRQYRRAFNPEFGKDMLAIKQRIDSGAGMLMYFGHSSSSSIDFNVENPKEYKNINGKYPMFLAIGCSAGSIFNPGNQRMSTLTGSLSDLYTFEPNKGSIAFIANSSQSLINYGNIYSRNWFRSMANFAYGKSIGEIHRETIVRSMTDAGSLDRLNRYNLEQVVLQGDPAIVPFPNDLPDYVVNPQDIKLRPLSPNLSMDSVLVMVRVANVGKGVPNTVTVRLQRRLPDGELQLVGNASVNPLLNEDSVQFTMPINGMAHQGANELIATVDATGAVAETLENNNEARLPVDLTVNAIFPVHPYRYSIVRQVPQLVASTANAAAKAGFYRLQVDTTALFNSPQLFTQDINTVGGAVQFNAPPNLQAGRVYYWRVSPVSGGLTLNWQQSSFLYQPALEEGFNQSHFYQHTGSTLDRLKADTALQRFGFADLPHDIYIVNSIYPISGREDGHFSVTVDGKRISTTGCLGQSIVFNVFDPVTFKPWDNAGGGRFGSAGECNFLKRYNFEFKYFPASNRKKIMDFLDSVPKGFYVSVRGVIDPPYDSLKVEYWQRDTSLFGTNKSLYHYFRAQGFETIDSLNQLRQFAMVFKKDEKSTYQPFVRVSDGALDRVVASAIAGTPDTLGNMISPWFGPSQQWKRLYWQRSNPANTDAPPTTSLGLWGRRINGTEVQLGTYDPSTTDVDVSGISAAEFPYLQLRMQTMEAKSSKAAQLNFWRLTYIPVTDGALSARDYFAWNGDTLNNVLDTIVAGIAFKNVGLHALAPVSYTVRLRDANRNFTTLSSGTLKPLNPGDTAIITGSKPAQTLLGAYEVWINVNGEKAVTEQHWFNNLVRIPVYIDTVKQAYQLVSFTAVPGNNLVNANWNVRNELKVKHYELMYGKDSLSMQALTLQSASNSGTILLNYAFQHQLPSLGNNYYRLRITDQFGNITYSNFINVPVQLVDFNITGNASGILAGWTLQNEIQVKDYQLRHGTDSNALNTVHTAAAANLGNPSVSLTHLHAQPVLGTNYYRMQVSGLPTGTQNSALQSVGMFVQNFEAEAVNKQVNTSWQMMNEWNLASYELQVGVDTLNMRTVSLQTPVNRGAGLFNFNFTHAGAAPGTQYYRVKVTDKAGNVQYSQAVQLFVGDPTVLVIYPNPFDYFVRMVPGNSTEPWEARLFDDRGRLLITKTGSGSGELQTGVLPRGIYFLHFRHNNNTTIHKLEKL